MRVLLVQSLSENKLPLFPIALAYVASAIKDKHDVRAFDMNIHADPWRALEMEIKNFSPDVVGVSLRNATPAHYPGFERFYDDFKKLLRAVRRLRPEATIIVGGGGFSLYAERIMKDCREIDIGVYLEGEETIAELLADLSRARSVRGCFVRDGEGFVFTGNRPFREFKDIPMASYELFDIETYKLSRAGGGGIGIQTKRGCLKVCEYCPYPFLNGPGMRLRDPADVADEMEFLAKNYGVTNFNFVDTVFDLPREHATAVCRELINRRLGINWGASFTLHDFNEEFARLAMESGCVFFLFSVDAFTDESLRALGKNYTQRDIFNIVEVAEKIDGIKLGLSFFIDTPGMTPKDLVALYRFRWRISKRLKGKMQWFPDLNRIWIEPHTGIYELAMRQGQINEKTDLMEPHFYSEPKMRPITAVMDFALFLLKPAIRAIMHHRHRKRAMLMLKKDLAPSRHRQGF